MPASQKIRAETIKYRNGGGLGLWSSRARMRGNVGSMHLDADR